MKVEDFKNIHVGESAVVFGSGPSLNRLSEQSLDYLFDDKVTIGSNEFVYFPRKVDYYFIGDAQNKKRGYNSDPETYNNFQAKKANFYRDPLYTPQFAAIPKGLKGIYYPCTFDPKCLLSGKVKVPFKDCYSISFEMLQFCCYAGFNRIYLVGHDCNYDSGTFKTKEVEESVKVHVQKILFSWFVFENWISINYPHIKVFNINPVSMRRFEVSYL